jgi:hypothetical protein
MTKAVVTDNVVTNIIEIEDKNVFNYEVVTGTLLFDISPLGIMVGDTYDGTDFYRNGVKLPIEEEETEPSMAEMEAALNELGVQTRES